MEEILTKFWAPIGSLIATIGALLVWGLRVEGKVKLNAKDIARESEARKDLEAKLEKQRSEDMASWRQVLGELRSQVSDVQGDMKEVLKVLGRLGG